MSDSANRYSQHWRVKTFDELRALVENQIQENVTLEYKSSQLIQNNDTATLCKVTTAFANSIGGTLIIGVKETKKVIELDGGFQGSSKTDWIYQIVGRNTFPPIENFEVIELHSEGGRYYIINVSASLRAPHQSENNHYYKRSGSECRPMEPYEVEDVRNRQKFVAPPLRIGLLIDDHQAFLEVINNSDDESLDDIVFDYKENFTCGSRSLERLKQRGLRKMSPKGRHVYRIDTFASIFENNQEAILNVSAKYKWKEQVLEYSNEFYFEDFLYTSIAKQPVAEAIEKIERKLDQINGTLKKMTDMASAWQAAAVDDTGVRLSQRTVNSLTAQVQKFHPTEFGWQGYQIILDIATEDAIALHRIFNFMSGPTDSKGEYESLPIDLRRKFERVFKVDFDD